MHCFSTMMMMMLTINCLKSSNTISSEYYFTLCDSFFQLDYLQMPWIRAVMANLWGLAPQKFGICLTWLCWCVTHLPTQQKKNNYIPPPTHTHIARPFWTAALGNAELAWRWGSGLGFNPSNTATIQKGCFTVFSKAYKPWGTARLPSQSGTP